MGTWQRLKQRKFVQWALAYPASAWLFLEVASVIGQVFEWPNILLRSLTVVLAVGFFAIFVIAWYHRERASSRAARRAGLDRRAAVREPEHSIGWFSP